VVLKSGIEAQRRCGDHDFRVDDVRRDNGNVAVTYSWRDAEGHRHNWGQVVQLRDGMIIDMEDRRPG
jgi:hypothetical protein